MKTIIFGAQGYALGTFEAFTTLYPEREIAFFMVSKMEGNPATLGGIAVREIAEVSAGMSDEEKAETEVIIATPENVQREIEGILDSYGFRNHSRMDSVRWHGLMNKYHAVKGQFKTLAELRASGDGDGAATWEGAATSGMSESLESQHNIEIYMAKSHKDKPLENKVTLPGYIYPLQVGAANADVKAAELQDNTGENISFKNGNYCELTGLYWVWKNRLCNADYVGLAQYRRQLMLSEADISALGANDVDVVLPFPLPYEPDINMHHKRYLKDGDWTALLTALEELEPEYAKAFPKVLGQRYMYNYNVILAKREVLREYCEWLFPILERTEELSFPKGEDRSDRYIGYMGETLETLYFMKNAERLNIVHTGCRMYV